MAAVGPEPSALHVRDATVEDMPAVTAIYAHHVLHSTATFEIDPPSVEEMTSRYQAIVGSGLPYHVCLRGSQVIGYSYAAPYRARVAYSYTVEDSVYVAHDHLGIGVGRRLLQAMLDAVDCARKREVIAVITDENGGNQASVNLHHSLGFVHAGRLKNVGFKFDRWIDTVFMQRSV